MESLAFVTSTPYKLKKGASNRGKHHPHACPTRASATNSTSGESEEHVEKLTKSRKALDQLINVDISASAGSASSGQCKCIWCEGTKKRQCSWCEGKGVRYEPVHRSWDEMASDLEKLKSGEAQKVELPKKIPVRCSACSGTKKLRCGYCHGSGIGSYGHSY